MPEKEENKSLVVTFRMIQAFCFGILALGLSMIFGDLTEFSNIPISDFAMTTTIFGVIGSIITGSLAKRCENW